MLEDFCQVNPSTLQSCHERRLLSTGQEKQENMVKNERGVMMHLDAGLQTKKNAYSLWMRIFTYIYIYVNRHIHAHRCI